MIPKPIQEVDEADIQALITGSREEGQQIDFKRDLPREDNDGKKALLSDICAFANTSGGDLVYGVLERDGVASEVVPQTLPASVDGYVLKLQSAIRDSIEPVMQGVFIKPVKLATGGHVLVIRVSRSFTGMHRVKRDGHFYVRKSRSNETLDVPGVISRVADYLGREDRLRAFFARRYADILSNDHSLTLSPGPKLVVHLVPARDFLDGSEVDLDQACKDVSVPFLSEVVGHSSRSTYDGRVFFDSHDGAVTDFTLLMRCGVVEACMDLIPPFLPDGAKKVDLNYIEECVLRMLVAFQTSSVSDHSTGWPVLVRAALLGTNGLPFGSGSRLDITRNYGVSVKQPLPVLALPEVLVNDRSVDVVDLMHPAFLRMWHAWGYPKSYGYVQKDGKWTRSR